MIWGFVRLTWQSSITSKSATLFDFWVYNLVDLRILKLYLRTYVVDDLRVYNVDDLAVCNFDDLAVCSINDLKACKIDLKVFDNLRVKNFVCKSWTTCES